MANYFVSPSGSNTSPYDTWSKAAHAITTVATHGAGVAGPHKVYIEGGPYPQISFSNANWASSEWYAYGPALIARAGFGDVVLNRTDDYPINAGRSCLIDGFTVAGGGASIDQIVIGAANITLRRIYAHDAPRYTLNIWNQTGLLIDQCLFAGWNAYSIYASGAASVEVRNSVLIGGGETRDGDSGIQILGSANITLNHSIVCGILGYGAENNGTGTLTVNNSVVFGGRKTTGSAPVRRGAGTVAVYNSLLVPGWYSKAATTGTIATDTANIKKAVKWTRRFARRGIIIPAVDDFGYTADAHLAKKTYIESWRDKLATRGWKGSWFVEGYDAENDSAKAAYAASIDSGGVISVGCHGYSHSDLGLSGNAFSITKEDHTINIDRTADTITVAGAAPVAVSGFKAKTLTAIRAELTTGGCTCGALTTNLDGRTRGESIADSSGAQASPYTAQLLIDATAATGFYAVEAVRAKSAIGTALGRECKTLAHPFGSVSVNGEAAIIAAGFKASRPGIVETRVTPGTGQTSMHIHRVAYCSGSTFVGANDAATEALIRSAVETMISCGGILCVLGHDEADVPQAAWTIFFRVMAEYQDLDVMSLDDVADMVVDGETWSTADSLTYTRTWSQPDPDFRIPDTSLLCNSGKVLAGVNDAGQLDYWGVATGQYPNIGMDQGAGAGFGPWSTSDGILPLSAQPCKGHAAPIGVGKITVFPGITSNAQIEEAK